MPDITDPKPPAAVPACGNGHAGLYNFSIRKGKR
jgi:hypothetical protein